MPVLREALAAWGATTAAGHAAELGVLAENAPGARLVWPCMWDDVPAVVGVQGTALVVATARRFGMSTGPASWRQHGSSAVIETEGITVRFVGVPQARRISEATRAQPLPSTIR